MIVENLDYSFKERKILTSLNLKINKGEIHSILGVTGAGKTLLLKLISGIQKIQHGKIELESTRLSYIFQQNAFFPWLKMAKNFAILKNINQIDVKSLFEEFQLIDYLDLYPEELSGGTLQKFNILRAFLINSDLILLDEPFSHLDIIQKESLYQVLIKLWCKKKPTLIIVTHDIDEALFLSHKISILSKQKKQITETFHIKDTNIPHFNIPNEARRSDNYSNQYLEIHKQLQMDLMP